MERAFLLGIPFDPLTLEQARERVLELLKHGKHHVMTPNSEMLVASTKNPAFRSILQHTALNVPDSMGIVLGARMTGQHMPERVAGVDLVRSLCTHLSSDHPVFFLGGHDGVAQRAASILQSENNNLVLAGVYEGSPDASEAGAIIQRINASGAHLLLVAYGAPKQDFWIHSYLSQLTTVRVAVGVGGTFDMISGSLKRAPKFMRSLGLEWLWRLILQPSRIGRILTATVVFPLLLLRYRRQSP